jgi:hypothetical protein
MSPLSVPAAIAVVSTTGLVIALAATGWLDELGVFLAASPLLVLATRARWFGRSD